VLENRFKANAANCLLLSDQVTYPIIRAGLLDIAHAWLELAEQANVEQSYYAVRKHDFGRHRAETYGPPDQHLGRVAIAEAARGTRCCHR
jgi:hypothetical protein